MEFALPLDDGFLRRQCPNCEREFKWYHDEEGEGGESVPPEEYFCPYCGEPGAPESWYTQEQVEYINTLMASEAGDLFNRELRKLERRSRGRLFSFKVTRRFDTASPSMPDEPNDMVAVASPCHPEEPIKVDEQWSDPLHCLVCGHQFAIE